MSIIQKIYNSVKGKQVSLVLPEGSDIRVLEAAQKITTDEVAKVILIGDYEEIKKNADSKNISIDNFTIVNPDNYDNYELFVEKFIELRNGKATIEQAKVLMRDATYIGTMMVKLGYADCLLSGAVHSTADTVRPALQIIKTKPNSKLVASGFYMFNEAKNQQFIFGDCAININPTSEQLVDIAYELQELGKVFEITEPKVGFLSFSTKGSAISPESQKVIDASNNFKNLYPNILSEGEMQFDAAVVESVGKQKAPESKMAGEANVLVFPDLNSGNIGYKIAQRLGDFTAIGPILIGLNAPINDLSRGCSAEDIYETAIITVAQSLQTSN